MRTRTTIRTTNQFKRPRNARSTTTAVPPCHSLATHRSIEPKQQKDECIQSRLFKVIGEVRHMPQRKPLRPSRRQMKVHSTHHGNKQRQGRGAREKAQRQQDAASEFDTIVQRRPQFRWAGQEPKVRSDDKVHKALKFGCPKVGGECRAPFTAVMNHEHAGHDAQGYQWSGMDALPVGDCFEEFGAGDSVPCGFFWCHGGSMEFRWRRGRSKRLRRSKCQP